MAALVAVAALVAGCDRAARTPPRPQVIAGPAAGEVAPWVQAQLADASGRDVVVYVGAAWCEPCVRFHDALTAGQLDGALPTVTLLEFDLDRDEARLAAAGYTSKLIPLFARPAADGRASGRAIEGSIAGPGAVDELTPRLRALLAQR